MPKETKIRQIGNSAGLTIPKELLDRQHLEEDARDYRNALRKLSQQ